MQLLLDGLHHRGVAMPGHQCAKAEVVIHVFVSVDIVNPARLSILYENRIRLIVPVIAGHAERDSLQRSLVRRGGLWCPLFVRRDFLL